MKPKIQSAVLILACCSIAGISCQKERNYLEQREEIASVEARNDLAALPSFNLEVILRNDGNGFGHVKFRQDVRPEKIIVLDTWIRDLEPNHEYLLQRAVDLIIDDNCTGTNWLTLGKGLTPQSILTDATGTGREELWRDISMLATGTEFDIHFRVLDATTMAVVLTSDCYQYVVR
jgi:hypothetical protein